MTKKHFVIMTSFVLTVMLGTLFWASISSSSDRGQAILDDYGRQPSNKQQTARFHLAMKLLTGRWNDAQKRVALKYINRPTKDLEPEIWANFSKDDAVANFYNIGTEDISDLRTIYAAPFGKGEIFNSWTAERKTRAAQQNLALGFVRYELSPDQQQFLIDYAERLPAIFAAGREAAQQQVSVLDAEAATKFARNIGRGLFATIGKDSCKPEGLVASIKEYFAPTCVCSTSTYNWSCNDNCHAATCNTDPGNCGPFYLWDCTAMCSIDDGQIQ